MFPLRKTCVKRPASKRPQIGFQDQLSLNASQKYCRMLQWEHSAILSTFIKLPFVIKIFVLSIFKRPFYTGFTVHTTCVWLRDKKNKFQLRTLYLNPYCTNSNNSRLLFSSAEMLKTPMANSVDPDQTAVLGPRCFLLYLICR